jgi:serine/threonine protein kinase/tetratricopeptide (TPR) repeat protein
MPVSVEAANAAFAGRYVVERELGRGGFAVVYLARDVRHNRQVAIKVLDPDLTQGSAKDRFHREISVTSKLSHPNILPLFDSGEAAGLLYYVMPFASGESLRARLDREGSLPIDEAVRICCEILDGLAHAHENNVLHRDLKPDNILIESGRAMVADFGIARALGTSEEIGITKTGFAVGTAGYMSPEQASGGRLDVRSDIYAVGCILYEMIAGETPITGPTPQAILGRILAGDIRSLRPVRHAVSEELDATVQRSLATSPVDRFPSAAAFRAELESHRSGANLRPTRATIIRTSAITPARRRIAAIVIPILLLAGGAIAFASYRAATNRDASLRGIAVMPLRVLGADADLSESLADLLSTTLEGTPDMRVVDPWSLWRPLRATPSGPVTSPDPERANDLSRRFGARYFVLGSVSEASRHLTLTLRMYRVGDAAQIGGGISIVGSSDSVNALAQRAAVALITRISDGAAPAAGTMDRPLTENADALKAYLEARLAMRRGLLDKAETAINRALALDTTFAVAAMDAIVIKSWVQFAKGRPYSGLRGLTQMAARHSAGLSEPQRLRIEMYAASVEDQGARAAEAEERLVQLDSADIDAWVMLSFTNLTLGWQYGSGPAAALAANDRAIALDSTHVPALAQRAYLSAWRGDSADIRRVLRLLHAADTSASMIRGYELALTAVSTSDAKYSALLDTIVEQPIERWLTVLRSLRSYRPDRAEQLIDRLLTRPGSRRAAMGARGQLLLAEGRAAEVGKQLGDGFFSEFPGLDNVVAAGILATSFTGVEDSAVTAMALSRVEARVRPDSALQHFNSRPVWWFGWLEGAHHAMRGDTARARLWQRVIMTFPAGGSPATYRESLREDIEARLAARAGDIARARAHATNAYRLWGIHDSNDPEFNPAPAIRFHLARLLQAANKPDSASMMYLSLTAPGTWMGGLGTRAELELGHIAFERGDRDEAAYHYGMALRMWERGGAGVARWRDEAKTGLERSGGEKSSVRFLTPPGR